MPERMAVECAAKEEPFDLVTEWIFHMCVLLKCYRLGCIIGPRLSHDNSLYFDTS
jgi:hypothetical protein